MSMIQSVGRASGGALHLIVMPAHDAVTWAENYKTSMQVAWFLAIFALKTRIFIA